MKIKARANRGGGAEAQAGGEARIIVRENGRFTSLMQYCIVLGPQGLFLRGLPDDQWSDSPTVMDVDTLTGFINAPRR